MSRETDRLSHETDRLSHEKVSRNKSSGSAKNSNIYVHTNIVLRTIWYQIEENNKGYQLARIVCVLRPYQN